MDRDWALLGKALQAARKAAGVSQDELASELDASRSAVQQIEAGKEFKKPTATIKAFARRVGWTDSSVEAVLAGGTPTLQTAVDSAAPAAEPPSPFPGLPLRIVHELTDDGALLDTAVVPLGGDARMVVVIKGSATASPEQIRRNLEAWRAAEQHLIEAIELEQGDGEDPSPAVHEA
ncbi:hypothetical protein AVW11_03775 [Streptomyces amritsarensis]|uniref:HTH cro/C1-type domain-containing protein n=1 Tax=Streptomyces amritsarensis TaxID=681158 RepID=A0ABX3G9B4_9ACTN|nr:helix-turn-helix transcriptional regulator [Streptomyces amritsarensis]OLZ72521.1 hypothetical protein AVW11_03775 [Streptomyces amritsarensis]